jgi:4-hydroxybenzoate polyprenyltransferase
LEPLSNKSLTDVLKTFGSHVPFLTALGLKTETGQAAAGIFLMILGGCVLGYFYALSEQRIPPKGLIADGLFYGFILWILGGIILGSFLGDEIQAILRSWAFLIHTLLYGVCLAIFAVLTERNHPTGPVTPRD